MFDTVGLVFALAVLAIAAWFLRAMIGDRRTIRISPWERGVVSVDGVFDRLLEPGRHTVWGSRRSVTIAPLSMALQYIQVGPVEVVTADRLPARLTATVAYRLHDAEMAVREPVWSPVTQVANTALVRLASAHSMEALLGRAEDLDQMLTAGVPDTIGAARIESIALSAVILPPELRRLMSEVERARLEGLAALERARGEQAALRSLANAARLLKDNPELAHLRLLQTAGTARNTTIIIGDRPDAHRAP